MSSAMRESGGSPKRRKIRAAAVRLAAVLALVASAAAGVFAAGSARLTVSAAISLKDALDTLGRAFEQNHPGTAIAFNYAGSGTLQHQIEQGAPVDVFVSASAAEMNRLQAEGLIAADTRRDIAGNTLVLIVPSGSSAVNGFDDLRSKAVTQIAIGEPRTVPAGRYAQQTLAHLHLWDLLAGKLVFAKDVRQVLTFVETGNAAAGFVYRTDGRISSRVRLVAEAPAGSHDPILYPAAVVRGSKHMALAGEFVSYLGTSAAQTVFQKFGFSVPNQ